MHGNLGAPARIAGGALELNQLLTNFRHFELEQLQQKLVHGAADKQLRAANLRTHLVQVAAHPVVEPHRLARNGVPRRDECIGVLAQIEHDAAALGALDLAADQLVNAVFVGVNHLGPLGLANALDNDLLGGMGGDAAKLGGSMISSIKSPTSRSASC